MPSSAQPADELARYVVETLRADNILSGGAGLLFPNHRPRVGPLDERVYTAGVELAKDSATLEALPRVLVATLQAPSTLEQQGDLLEAPVSVITHVLADKEDEELCVVIDARVATVLLSTAISDVRIIAAGLVADGTRSKGRIPTLNDAWEIVTRYRSAHVGVLT